MNPKISENTLFIDACLKKPVERTPVWIMRQAGRYLPQYQAIRRNHDFMSMYKTPELAAEVTLQPVDVIGVDAAIIFSDILVVPEAMGMELQFVEGRGPVFPRPLREEAQVDKLLPVKAVEQLSFVMDAIALSRKNLAGRAPLIGFSGAPWTLATYMIEGSGSKNFTHIKQWRFARPELLHRLLDKITDAVIDYCRAQMAADAQAIQLFDSWAGILDEEGFTRFALPYARRIFQAIWEPEVPLIYFAKGAGGWLHHLRECGAQVIGLDWTVDLHRARQVLGNATVIQGNLDPTALYAPPETIRRLVRDMLTTAGQNPRHVANLGHGILPDIPVEHAREFVNAVKEESPRFHIRGL